MKPHALLECNKEAWKNPDSSKASIFALTSCTRLGIPSFRWIVPKKQRASYFTCLFLLALSLHNKAGAPPSSAIFVRSYVPVEHVAGVDRLETGGETREGGGKAEKERERWERDDERARAYCSSGAALIQQRKSPLQPDENPSVFFLIPPSLCSTIPSISSIIHWHFQTLCFQLQPSLSGSSSSPGRVFPSSVGPRSYLQPWTVNGWAIRPRAAVKTACICFSATNPYQAA